MTDVSLSGGDLVVDVERKQVVETIAAVDKGDVSLDNGLLIAKEFAGKLNENIKGATGAMRAATIEDRVIVKEQPQSDKATIARNRLGDALIQQLQLVNTATSGSAQGSFFKVTGLGEIEYDLEQRLDTGQIRMDKEVGDMVRMYANKRYNGNITAMIADRGRRLETLERSQIEDLGFKFQAAYADYRKVLKNSNKKKYYIKNLRRLGVLTGDLEQSLIKEVETSASSGQGTLANPWVIEWTGNKETDLKIMASIGSGEHYVDSAGGVRVKK